MQKKNPTLERDRYCHFCVHALKEVDYKDISVLQRFTSNYAKILPRERMGTCSKHQRKLAQGIKRARFMALIPYTNR